MRQIGRIICVVVAGLSFGLSALLGLAFHDRYWRWRDCFNELGRCYDPENQTVMTDAAFVWGLLAALAFMVALLFSVLARRRPAALRSATED